MLGLKEAGQQAGVAAALPVLTIFLWVSMARRLAEPMREMALKTGRDIDALQEECQVAPITPGAYVQPALKLRGADFDEVISECRKMQAVLEVYDEGAEGRKAAKLAVLEWGVKEEGGEAL